MRSNKGWVCIVTVQAFIAVFLFLFLQLCSKGAQFFQKLYSLVVVTVTYHGLLIRHESGAHVSDVQFLCIPLFVYIFIFILSRFWHSRNSNIVFYNPPHLKWLNFVAWLGYFHNKCLQKILFWLLTSVEKRFFNF